MHEPGERESSPPVSAVFGPLRSRRFGLSLGINNVPGKRCAYSCVYCQAGSPALLGFERNSFFHPEAVATEVREAVRAARARGEHIDHLTFAPAGEPTLDIGIGRIIELIKPIGIPVVVLTNGVVVGRADVAVDLAAADWVSIKVDAVTPRLWHVLNRPARGLDLDMLKDGMRRFARTFPGRLTTETMLVDGLDTLPEELEAIATFVAELRPAVAYVAVPTRPPAVDGVHAPTAAVVDDLCARLERRAVTVERLTGVPEPGQPGAGGGDLERTLLDVTEVHPVQRHEVEELVRRCHSSWEVVEELIRRGRLERVVHAGREFLVRRREDGTT
jgi:wyosine [tRNA(Phe)-imidazoG37] synthetase (radical SAM superfamily)